MGRGTYTNFESASNFPEQLDVLPVLTDGIDYLTAEWWNHLASGSIALQRAIGPDPTTYPTVTWPTGYDSLAGMMDILSRQEGGYVTLAKTSNGYTGSVSLPADRFRHTSSNGVPLVVMLAPAQDIGERDADAGGGRLVNDFLGMDWTFTYSGTKTIEYCNAGPYVYELRYDSATNALTGFEVKSIYQNSQVDQNVRLAFFVLEFDLG